MIGQIIFKWMLLLLLLCYQINFRETENGFSILGIVLIELLGNANIQRILEYIYRHWSTEYKCGIICMSPCFYNHNAFIIKWESTLLTITIKLSVLYSNLNHTVPLYSTFILEFSILLSAFFIESFSIWRWTTKKFNRTEHFQFVWRHVSWHIGKCPSDRQYNHCFLFFSFFSCEHSK